MNSQMLRATLLVLTIGAAAGCDNPTPAPTPSVTLPAGGTTGLSGTWQYTMELVRQTEGEVCGRVLSDPGRTYKGTTVVRQGLESSITIGSVEEDLDLQGRLEGHTIVASGRSGPIGNPWCEQYRLFHDIDWTLDAVVESDTTVRGTVAGRFKYYGSGEAAEVHLDRVWTLVLNRQ